MATNALGAGTCNLCVNIRRTLHRALGRMAFARDMSLGAFVRGLLGLAGIVSEEVARNRRNALELAKITADGRVCEKEIEMLREIERREHESAQRLEIARS